MNDFDYKVRKARAEIVVDALIDTNGNCSKAAVNLGIHRNTLGRVLKEANLSLFDAKAIVRQRRRALMLGAPRPVVSAQARRFGIRRMA